MEDFIGIMALPITIALVAFGFVGIIYGSFSYFPIETTYWFEESHLVCKEVKASGFNAKVVKKCYILEAIK